MPVMLLLLSDFGRLMTGPLPPTECARYETPRWGDTDYDGDVDLRDLAKWQELAGKLP